jgi:putative PIN family toxin of toxin-antitoxin system
MSKPLIVIDTNVFISAQLIESSVSALVFDKILQIGGIALSEAVLNEYTNVLYRKKLDRYLSKDRRQVILRKIRENAIMFSPTIKINECRDKKDNMILELALACEAICIVTGDADLSVMRSFRSIPILSGAEFLATFT